MVTRWGMSERLGPMTYGKKEEESFLGREISQHRDYSEQTAQVIDEEIKTIITDAERRAEDLLRANEDKLHLLVNTLLEFEVLDGSQIDRILAGETLPPPTHMRRHAQEGNGRREDAAQESGAPQEEIASSVQEPAEKPAPAD